jgi:PmbA protein
VSGVPEQDLEKVAEIACQAATAAGAEFVDASAERGRGISVTLEKNAIKSSDVRTWQRISIRAFSRGGTGWYTISGLYEENAREAGRLAAELSQAAEPDPDFLELVSPAPCPEVSGLYDPRLTEIGAAEVASWVTDNIEPARLVAEDALVSGGARTSWVESALVNNLGVSVTERSTSASVNTQVVIRRDGDVGSFYEWDVCRQLSDLEPGTLGARAASEALRYLRSRTMKTAVLPVVFGPLPALGLLQGLCAAASAEAIQRNRSFLVNRKGTRVASEQLTIVDDPLIPAGLSSGICDGDGFPHRRVAFLEEGVLLTYLHSQYTAHKSGEENTGHSTRGGISPTNANPLPGTRSAAEIISEVDDGVYVTLGSPAPDTASGQVSALVDAGFRIERGELTYPLRNTMVAGEGLELLAGIDAVSSDYRSEPGRVLPTMRVQGMKVAGED